jgi:hypothetical protein
MFAVLSCRGTSQMGRLARGFVGQRRRGLGLRFWNYFLHLGNIATNLHILHLTTPPMRFLHYDGCACQQVGVVFTHDAYPTYVHLMHWIYIQIQGRVFAHTVLYCTVPHCVQCVIVFYLHFTLAFICYNFSSTEKLDAVACVTQCRTSIY